MFETMNCIFQLDLFTADIVGFHVRPVEGQGSYNGPLYPTGTERLGLEVTLGARFDSQSGH
jgi:hypothetical protein